MPDPPSAATPTSSGPLFIPKETVTVVIGNKNCNLYPRVDASMRIEEKAYAFHVTRTALRSLGLAADVYLDNLGLNLDAVTIVDGLKFDFRNFFDQHWLDFQNLEILSFHNTAGAIMNNAVTPADISVLKPVLAGPVAQCRPEDVRFVRLQMVLDFDELCTGADDNDNTALSCDFYLELPQTNVQVNDGHGNPRNLRTFHGQADLRLLTVQEMRDQILHLVPQDHPIGLTESAFNVANATIDDTSVMEGIQRSIYKLSISTIESTIFEALCPNYTNKPQAAVENLTQTTIDGDGNPITLSVAQFHSILSSSARTFTHQAVYPVDVCGIFQRGLHDDVRAVYQELYPDHSAPVPLDGRTQRMTLIAMLRQATIAEQRVYATQKLVARQVGASFHTDAYASQAERTLTQYQPGGSPDKDGTNLRQLGRVPGLGRRDNCFACGSPLHPYKKCPKRNDPTYQAIAKENYAKWLESRRGQRNSRWKRREPDLLDMSKKARKKVRDQVLALEGKSSSGGGNESTDGNDGGATAPPAAAAGTVYGGGSNYYGPASGAPAPAPHPFYTDRGRGRGSNNGGRPSGGNSQGPTGGRGPVVFTISANVLNNSTRQTLPVPINTSLPHVALPLWGGEGVEAPMLLWVLDTAAALTTGNSQFMFKFAAAYPQCIAGVYAPENYSPIILSGVVQKKGSAVTTELPVAFLLNLGLFTKDGQPAQLMVACGPHVGVNLILGNPFIQSVGMVIDYGDNLCECRALDCAPFPIEYRRARLELPAVAVTSARAAGMEEHRDFLVDLQRLEAYVTQTGVRSKVRKHKATQRVRFDPYDLRRYCRDGILPQGPQSPGNSYDALEADQENRSDDTDDVKRPSVPTPCNRFAESLYDHANDDLSDSDSSDGSIPGLAPRGWSEYDYSSSSSDSDSDDDSVSSSYSAMDDRQCLHGETQFDQKPIRPAAKPPKGKKRKNVFIDDRGFPDQSDEFDQLLHNVDGGTVLRKRRHPPRPLDDIDPAFNVRYDETKHGKRFASDFKPSPLLSEEQNGRLADLIKKYWPVFHDAGLFIPVKDYECEIDTGTAAPIAVKGINYGPRETPIMRECVAKLEKLGHISQTRDGQWLFKALLAPKPHQEHVHDIADFVWRFCVNYIPLNAVTRVVAYPIPRCDTAVYVAFGKSKWFWLMDAPQGYHQLRVAPGSREKLAFQGPDAIKWTWNVMPFGPVNGPQIFIEFMHDMDSTWKDLAASRGISIDEDTNTRLIVDDLMNYAISFELALHYLECQLLVCRSQNLSLKLSKCHWFPKRLEFVGVDVTLEGNRPAQSKHELLQSWPTPSIIRDVASFVGFAVFYALFIPMFECRVKRLRELMKLEYTEQIGNNWDDQAKHEFDDIRKALLDDPCIKRFDHRKRLYLLTDFCKNGFGYCATQPGDDDASLAAMRREMAGGECEFLTKESKLILHPVAFGCRRTRGNETRLHSHLGEGFAGDWAINKCRHMTWGMRFTWITDCYALRFILSYDGNNPAILRLQMRLMCWDMVIIHRAGLLLIQPDYLSRLGADMCFDPFLRDYIQQVQALKLADPAVSSLPMRPEHMPGYRAKRGKKTPETSDDTLDKHAMNLLSTIYVDGHSGNPEVLSIVPITFDSYPPTIDLSKVYRSRPLYNAELVLAARTITEFQWGVYSFNSGHFHATAITQCLPFRVVLAADMFAEGRALFKEFTRCQLIFSGVKEMYDHVRRAGDRSKLDGYLLHSHRLPTSASTHNFWQLQASLILELRKIRSLSMFVAVVHPDHDGRAITTFIRALTGGGWVISDTSAYSPDYGDSVAASCRIVIGVHSETDSTVSPCELPCPPQSKPNPISAYVWQPFNDVTHAVSYAQSNDKFGSVNNSSDSLSLLEASSSKQNATSLRKFTPQTLYCLHRHDDDHSVQSGAQVMSRDHLCPPFSPSRTTNLFGHLFGIEYVVNGELYVRPISQFEFVKCFNLPDDITYRLSHPANEAYLDAAIPCYTSRFLMKACHSRLCEIRDANIQIYEPSSVAAPAALSNVFVNGAIGSRLPDADTWIKCYDADPHTAQIKSLIRNPGLITNESLAKIHASLRMPLRHSLLVIEDEMIYFREPLGDGSDSYCKLKLVPSGLYNVIFVAFHANPIGGHLNHVRTFRNIRLRYFWPEMYSYCKRMCAKCPGCALANRTSNSAKELIYSFPMSAPMMVLHVDGYSAGAHKSFEGDSTYCIACCGMTTFALMESVRTPDAKGFAAALMRILLRFGICHTIVLDKSSLFFGVFQDVVRLLNLNSHTISGENHNAMLVERVNRFINKGLRVMTNERESVRVACESILLLLYAWNSAPIPGTDIPRSLVVTGRVFSFPIDFSSARHLDLISTPDSVQSYAKDQAQILAASREIAKVLLEEHRAWHRELINSRRPNPRIFNVGDIVFAKRATKSDARRERVGKLMYPMTGPWRIVERLVGASYRIEHCLSKGRFDKKHASHLSPYPLELVPFEPLDGPDTRYSQLFKPIGKSPFSAAGLKGFEPSQPFKVPVNYMDLSRDPDFYWPSVAELNDEMSPFPWLDGERVLDESDQLDSDEVAAMYTGPPPTPPATDRPRAPTISSLVAAIIASTDRLFFIAHKASETYREWRLVRVVLDDSIALHPACLQDGKFLVEFYIPHVSDGRYNCPNQRFWLQYHLPGDITSPTGASITHLIRPSDTSAALATKKGLIPFRQWITLIHEDVYIHGPFDFATLNSRKTRDRISIDDWTILASRSSLYGNPAPSLDMPSYSVHIDRGTHCYFHSPSICAFLSAVAQTPGDRLYR